MDVTLNPSRTKSCYTVDNTESWELALRPVSGVVDDSPGNVRNSTTSTWWWMALMSHVNKQIFVEFDTSDYSGITTALTFSALSTVGSAAATTIEKNIFVAGVNVLYPETPQIYWPEVIINDFSYYEQVDLPENTRLIHNVPGEITLGNTINFCIGSWRVITEVPPEAPAESTTYEAGCNFVADYAEYTLEFEAIEPPTKGNVLFNAFSL